MQKAFRTDELTDQDTFRIMLLLYPFKEAHIHFDRFQIRLVLISLSHPSHTLIHLWVCQMALWDVINKKEPDLRSSSEIANKFLPDSLTHEHIILIEGQVFPQRHLVPVVEVIGGEFAHGGLVFQLVV